ncbi:MAG: CBS domain-containing protein [Halolamina sp.]|uniref:CBS domain-containing protein n=1 Tax=Halolamina sp. TaxID=1940283 RepID=UPI002FC36050
MSIREVMSTELVTISPGGTLQEAVTKMLDERVGSVVVNGEDEPVGIITETDVLAVGTTFESPFSEIPVSRAMSENPVSIGPETSLEESVETMKAYGIKKLPVVEDGSLVGIITLTDLVYQQHELIDEIEQIEQQRSEVDRTPETD